MKDTEKELKEELGHHFVAHSQRMKMLVKLILGLLKLGTISYSQLSKVINPKVKRSSNYKRIQRFVRNFSFCQKAYVQLVWWLFVGKQNWVALSMDRTNWKFGESNINILMLGISYKGTAQENPTTKAADKATEVQEKGDPAFLAFAQRFPVLQKLQLDRNYLHQLDLGSLKKMEAQDVIRFLYQLKAGEEDQAIHFDQDSYRHLPLKMVLPEGAKEYENRLPKEQGFLIKIQ